MIPIYSNEDIERFDRLWRNELENYTNDDIEFGDEIVEYYSRKVKKWLLDARMMPVDDWEKSFRKYCHERRNSVENFLQGKFQQFQCRESSKTRAVSTAEHLERKANECLTKWIQSLPSNTTHNGSTSLDCCQPPSEIDIAVVTLK